MGIRRCPCRPGTVRRGACLVLLLVLVWAVRATLLPSLRLLGGLFGTVGHDFDHCSPHAAITNLLVRRHSARTNELDCLKFVQGNRNSSSGGVASTIPPRCMCAAEPLYGWPATVAGSWSTPIACDETRGATTRAMRRRHCGTTKYGEAAWDVEHSPETQKCGGERTMPDDIRILFASSKHRKRLRVGGCQPFTPTGLGTHPNESSGLPNGGQCFLEPLSSLNYLPIQTFDAVVYEIPMLPALPAYLTDARGRPTLAPLHTNSVVGVMSLEPSSYYPLASQGCLNQHDVAVDLRPSLQSAVPLPYFSWALHPLNLPVAGNSPGAEQATRTRIRYPRDKVPGELSPPLAFGSSQGGDGGNRVAASVVWIASNCQADNWRRKLVIALRRYSSHP